MPGQKVCFPQGTWNSFRSPSRKSGRSPHERRPNPPLHDLGGEGELTRVIARRRARGKHSSTLLGERERGEEVMAQLTRRIPGKTRLQYRRVLCVSSEKSTYGFDQFRIDKPDKQKRP